MTRAAAAALAAGLALAACDMLNPSGGGDGGGERSATEDRFAHSQSDDISGVYRPEGRIGSDATALTQVFIGQSAEFEAWEAGRRGTDFAPVMLEFAGVDGGPVRVLPERYDVSDGRVRMSGRAEGVGRVELDARLDKGALATARRNLGEAEAPALTATLTVGGSTHSGVKLRWYGGD